MGDGKFTSLAMPEPGVASGDARTVRPGEPVRYMTALEFEQLSPRKYTAEESAAIQRDVDAAFAGGLAPFGGPVPAQPDPSKIIGVVGQRPHEPEYPTIPPAGFYWAKCSNDTPDEWTVVRVFEEPEGGRWVENTVGGGADYVHEWGPKLEPPGAATIDQRQTSDEAEQIKRCVDVAWGEDAIANDERKVLAQWIDRAAAALKRVEAIDDNGYDPITDTGDPR